jgi:hypothetical protein
VNATFVIASRITLIIIIFEIFISGQMAYQFRPPHSDRSYGRPPPGIDLTSTSSHSHDWQAQQSLFMGMNSPTYHRQILVSPPASNIVPNFGAASLPYQGQPNDTSTPFPGQVMIPSSTYNYGNPGYYYDPLQFPVYQDTQTSPLYAPPPDTYVHICNTSPLVDSSATGNIPLHQVHFAVSPTVTPPTTVPRHDDHSSHESPIYTHDIADDNSSIHQLSHHSFDAGNNPLHTQVHHQDPGCQASTSPTNAITFVKDAKKISLPYFDPTKMTWTSFAMKLHASLIECDLAYLL